MIIAWFYFFIVPVYVRTWHSKQELRETMWYPHKSLLKTPSTYPTPCSTSVLYLVFLVVAVEETHLNPPRFSTRSQLVPATSAMRGSRRALRLVYPVLGGGDCRWTRCSPVHFFSLSLPFFFLLIPSSLASRVIAPKLFAPYPIIV